MPSRHLPASSALTSLRTSPFNTLLACCLAVLLTACGSAPMRTPDSAVTPVPEVRSEAASEQGSVWRFMPWI